MAAVIRVLIADDHLIFRMGLKSLLNNEPDIAVVGEAMTGAQTIEKFRALRPDVVVLDLRMPDGGGMLALAGVREARSDAKVLVLSSYASDVELYQTMQAGAPGHVRKDGEQDARSG